MGALKWPIAILLASVPGVADAESMKDWRPYIAEAAQRFAIPENWIERVIRAESGGRTSLNGSPIRSRAGAIGLMQLMPTTWAEMRENYVLGPDPDDPRDNILAGTAYLRLLYDRFGYPGLFAAYNAGPGRYAEHIARGRALPGETIAYSARVSGGRNLAWSDAVKPPMQTLFSVENPRVSATLNASEPQHRSDGLFALKKGQ